MSRGTKIGCAIAAAIFVIAAIVCLAGGILAKAWFDDLKTEYDERRPQMEADAKTLAAGGAEACVKTGLEMDAACGEIAIKCHAEATVRTNMCLKLAAVPAGFCDDVPSSTAIIDVSMWGLAECARRGYGENDKCAQFMAKTVAKRCETP